MSRARTPEADGRPGGGHVDEAGRAVVGQEVAEELLVGHPMRTTGDDAEGVLGEPHDREVRPEAATWAEHRRVDNATDRDVHLREYRLLERIERSGAVHVEDRERGQVEDAR